MTEIYKNYEFNLHNPQVKAQSLSMSSFPGELFSDGDIYLMSSGLVVVSTTLHIYNNSIYKDINPQAVVRTPPTLPHQTTYACLHLLQEHGNIAACCAQSLMSCQLAMQQQRCC